MLTPRLSHILFILSTWVPLFAYADLPEQNWSLNLGGEYYYDHTVSIGHNGSQVFLDSGYPEQFTRLLSSHGGTNGTAVWTRHEMIYALNRSVDSSEFSDVHGVVRQEQTSGNRARLLVFRSSSGSVPIAEYLFTNTSFGAGKNFIAISDDGRWAVGATTRNQGLEVIRLDLESSNPSTPTYSEVLDPFGPEQSFAASADGKRFYVGGVYSGTIINLVTGERLFEYQYPFGAAERGHSLSADGSTLVVPVAGKINVFKESGNTYELVRALDPFPNTTQELPYATAVSSDGSVIAASYAVSPSFQNIHLHAWDSSTGEELLGHTIPGTGTWNNLPTDLELSGDGRRLVISLLGDQGQLADEVQIFERDANSGVYSPKSFLALSGSVYALDLSRSGDHLVLSRRQGHAATAESTKIIETYDLGSDLRIYGMPAPGAQVTVRYRPESLSPLTSAHLLVSPQAVASGELFPFGTLYLVRDGLQLLPMDDSDGDGVFETRITLPGSGSAQYLQGYTTAPRGLSDSWRTLSSLP